MRLIGTLDTPEQAKLFGANLRSKKIDHSVEGCSIWISNEDQVDEAVALLKQFRENPTAPEFDKPIEEPVVEEKMTFDPETGEPIVQDGPELVELLVPRRTGHFTAFLIAFCTLIYFLSAFQEIPFMEKGIPQDQYISTPIQRQFFFDVPPEVEKLDEMVEAYNPPLNDKQIHPLPPAIQSQIKIANTTPFWRGAADIFLLKMKGADTSIAKGPLFVKISQGEFWRFVTPIFLHGSILHVLFNMLWLWVLGKQVEQRVGVFRYLILTLILAVLTNTAQYVMSGPFFLGYSGVIMGLAGFIWSREKVAPWEGYPLHKSMILFLVLFVLAMFFLQIVSTGLFLFSVTSFNPNIANTAHIGGAILGALLGRLPFFAARPVS